MTVGGINQLLRASKEENSWNNPNLMKKAWIISLLHLTASTLISVVMGILLAQVLSNELYHNNWIVAAGIVIILCVFLYLSISINMVLKVFYWQRITKHFGNDKK